MRPINHKMNGHLYQKNGEMALLIDNAAAPLFLRYAYLIHGPEDPIFPAFLLDDWGREIRKLELYHWVEQNGNEFPRAEIFGYELNGQETQVFLRALELYARLPCYVFPDKTTPVNQGHLLQHILIPDPSITQPTPIKRPNDLTLPLARARLTYWHINPQQINDLGYLPFAIGNVG